MLKKWVALFIITTFVSSLFMKNASAETPFQAEKFPYKDMQIQIMPEFDYPSDWPKNTPSLLVGIYGTITNKSGQDYSGNIEIPVPVKDKNFEVNLVAEFPDVNKSEVQRPFTIDQNKGVIAWKPGKAIKNNETYRYVIEYYTNSISVKDKKSFTYNITNQADVDTLDVIYYAPMSAKNIQMTPKAQNTSKSDYGEDLYYYEYKNVKKGNHLQYSFSYTKEGNDSSLSVINKLQSKNNKQTQTKNQNSTKASSNKQPIIGIGGASIIGIAIIIAGLFVFFGLKGNSRPSKPSSSTSNKINKRQPNKSVTKKDNKLANEEKKKELRKKLLNGKIDQETYEEEMKKLI